MDREARYLTSKPYISSSLPASRERDACSGYMFTESARFSARILADDPGVKEVIDFLRLAEEEKKAGLSAGVLGNDFITEINALLQM